MTIEKRVGETPLEALERLRSEQKIPANIPLAYAGRLDPMAEGTLLILIGDECKKQTQYHSLDKEYVFEVAFGISSDTGDVLGIVRPSDTILPIGKETLVRITKDLRGDIELPYPHFSSKTVGGKPLHMWTLEGRLKEISVPLKRSKIHMLRLIDLRAMPKKEFVRSALAKIESIPEVTDLRKALGRDFRRSDVRASWERYADSENSEQVQVATFVSIASSGTYMRTLAEKIAERGDTRSLAYSIRRTVIGRYLPLFGNRGFWLKKY